LVFWKGWGQYPPNFHAEGDVLHQSFSHATTDVTDSCRELHAARRYYGDRRQSNYDGLAAGSYYGRVSALQPVQRRSTQHDASTVVGLLNARSVGSLSKQLAVHDRIVSDRLHLCAVVET